MFLFYFLCLKCWPAHCPVLRTGSFFNGSFNITLSFPWASNLKQIPCAHSPSMGYFVCHTFFAFTVNSYIWNCTYNFVFACLMSMLEAFRCRYWNASSKGLTQIRTFYYLPSGNRVRVGFRLGHMFSQSSGGMSYGDCLDSELKTKQIGWVYDDCGRTNEKYNSGHEVNSWDHIHCYTVKSRANTVIHLHLHIQGEKGLLCLIPSHVLTSLTCSKSSVSICWINEELEKRVWNQLEVTDSLEDIDSLQTSPQNGNGQTNARILSTQRLWTWPWTRYEMRKGDEEVQGSSEPGIRGFGFSSWPHF